MSEQVIQIGPLRLAPVEVDLLGHELDGLIEAIPPERARPYRALEQSVRGGAIPSEQLALLESVLELILGSGRVRHDHRAEGERILQGVYKRTARGQSSDANLAKINQALSVLKGQELAKVDVSSQVPGRYAVTISSDTIQIQLSIDARGIRLEKTTI